MFDYLDFNLTHYLDSLASEYQARGYQVSFLPFIYPADFLPLAASSTAERTVTIDHDSDFALTQQMAATFDAGGAGILFPNNSILLTLSTAQRQTTKGPVAQPTMFGTASRPYRLYKPLVLPAKSSFVVQATRLGAADQSLRLSFCGVKIFLTRLAQG